MKNRTLPLLILVCLFVASMLESCVVVPAGGYRAGAYYRPAPYRYRAYPPPPPVAYRRHYRYGPRRW